MMFVLIAFVPMTALSLRMYACDDWAPETVTVKWNDGATIVENQWFYDNSVSCNDGALQVLISYVVRRLRVLNLPPEPDFAV